MIVRLIHGIHSPEGNNNITAFAPVMQQAMPGARIDVFSYGFMGFWAARWENPSVAKRLASVSNNYRKEKEVWITHSNGAAVAYLATVRFGAKPDMIVNFNPALDRWRVAPVPWVETIHSNQDRAVYAAQFLPGHIWGDQGKLGIAPTAFKSPEHNRYVCHNASKVSGRMSYDDHVGAFTTPRRQDWAFFTANRIDEILSGG